jgi:hypothetical protein
VVRRPLALVPVTLTLVGLRLPPALVPFVGWPVGQHRRFVLLATCAAREAGRSIHDAIVAIVIG